MQAEMQSERLQEEISSMEYQRKNSFTAPPCEWITHRLDNLREVLNQNTSLSSGALKELLGTIFLEPKLEKERDLQYIAHFKPHYVAHSKIKTLALLHEEHKGSNWSYWRRE